MTPRYRYSSIQRSMAAEYLMRVVGGRTTNEADIRVVAGGFHSTLIDDARKKFSRQAGMLRRVEAAITNTAERK